MRDEAHADQVLIQKTARTGTRRASTRVGRGGGATEMVYCRRHFCVAFGSLCDTQLDGVFGETLYMVHGFRPSDDHRCSTDDSLQEEGALATRAR